MVCSGYSLLCPVVSPQRVLGVQGLEPSLLHGVMLASLWLDCSPSPRRGWFYRGQLECFSLLTFAAFLSKQWLVWKLCIQPCNLQGTFSLFSQGSFEVWITAPFVLQISESSEGLRTNIWQILDFTFPPLTLESWDDPFILCSSPKENVEYNYFPQFLLVLGPYLATHLPICLTLNLECFLLIYFLF